MKNEIEALPPVTPKQSFEGMTNGEVIKAIFKNMLYKKGDDEETICAYCYPNPHNANGEVMIFDRLWWNAPYEGGEQE